MQIVEEMGVFGGDGEEDQKGQAAREGVLSSDGGINLAQEGEPKE